MILNNVTSISEELPFCEVKLKIYSEESVCKKTTKKQQHKSKIHNSFTKATTTNKSLESHQNSLVVCEWSVSPLFISWNIYPTISYTQQRVTIRCRLPFKILYTWKHSRLKETMNSHIKKDILHFHFMGQCRWRFKFQWQNIIPFFSFSSHLLSCTLTYTHHCPLYPLLPTLTVSFGIFIWLLLVLFVLYKNIHKYFKSILSHRWNPNVMGWFCMDNGEQNE